MESIGDSASIVSECKEEAEKVKCNLDKLSDTFHIMLMEEEDRLHQLEDQRIKMEKEIEVLADQIAEERKFYRESMEKLLDEREKLTTKYIEDFHKEFPDNQVLTKANSYSSLIQACKSEIESIATLNFDIEIDTEQIRNEVIGDQACKKSKEDYIKSMKEFLEAKKDRNWENRAILIKIKKMPCRFHEWKQKWKRNQEN